MKNLKILGLLIVFALVAAVNSPKVHAWGSTGGGGTRFAELQETAVFFNNSGATLTAGDVVILDTAGTGVTAGTTLGAYVTRTTSADSVLAVGVVKSVSSADQTPVVVVTKGPVDTWCMDASDAVTIDTAVGTATTAGRCGGGTNLGIALEAGDSPASDNTGVHIWVDPTGAD